MEHRYFSCDECKRRFSKDGSPLDGTADVSINANRLYGYIRFGDHGDYKTFTIERRPITQALEHTCLHCLQKLSLVFFSNRPRDARPGDNVIIGIPHALTGEC